MTRSRASVTALAAVLGLVAFTGAQAATKAKHKHIAREAAPLSRPVPFPVYVDHGSDRNPGGDNLYFSDTRQPDYIVGPAWFQRWEDR